MTQGSPSTAASVQAGDRTRVAILGGGAGGVAAAFWLTSDPTLCERFEVTLFSRGWRLGGKAASGRNLDQAARIEEHGIHVLMGCYQNAFRTLRACYADWSPPADNRFRTLADALAPERDVCLWEGSASDVWHVHFPKLPGSPVDTPAPSAIKDLLRALVERMSPHLKGAPWLGSGATATVHERLDGLHGTLDSLEEEKAARQAADHVAALHGVHRQHAPAPETLEQEARHLWILLDIGLAMAKGILEDVLLPAIWSSIKDALDKLNALDFRRWIGSHGASQSSLDAAPLSALYDLAFAYRNGDSSDPSQASMAAGVTLRFALEFVLDYRDAPLWRMRAGMGDVIFTPFYQVLRDRGVDIRLFHAVREIVPSTDGRSVARVRIDRQADVVDGPYDPLVRVRNLDCWPNQPCWDQLCDGEKLKAAGVNFESVWDTTSVETIELEAERDFDVVILAVPPEMQKHVAPQLAPAGSRFETMLRDSAAVATVSTQLWLSKETDEIADYGPEPLMGTLPDPYDTWADMSDVLPAEAWPEGTVQSVQYLCGVIETPPPGKDPIGEGHRLAERHAMDWLDANAARVWPLTSWPAAPETGASPITSTYYRGNVEPSELYVLTPEGNNVASRLAGAATGYTNLVVAGDWTRTRFSGGCFESAIEAGMVAARAISGKPENIVGEE